MTTMMNVYFSWPTKMQSIPLDYPTIKLQKLSLSLSFMCMCMVNSVAPEMCSVCFNYTRDCAFVGARMRARQCNTNYIWNEVKEHTHTHTNQKVQLNDFFFILTNTPHGEQFMYLLQFSNTMVHSDKKRDRQTEIERMKRKTTLTHIQKLDKKERRKEYRRSNCDITWDSNIYII